MKNIKRMRDCTSQRDLTPTGNSQSEPTLGCMISISLKGRGVCVWWWGGGGGGVCVGGGGGSMFKYDCMDRCLPNVSSPHHTSYVYLHFCSLYKNLLSRVYSI